MFKIAQYTIGDANKCLKSSVVTIEIVNTI